MAKSNVYRGEIIGKTIKIIDSKNPSNVGIQGKVVNETKNTLVIDGKRVFKKNIIIKINNQTVEGKQLLKRPEERIK